MSEELVKALLYIAKFCVVQESCENCPLHAFCLKQPSSWWAEPVKGSNFTRPRPADFRRVLCCRRRLPPTLPKAATPPPRSSRSLASGLLPGPVLCVFFACIASFKRAQSFSHKPLRFVKGPLFEGFPLDQPLAIFPPHSDSIKSPMNFPKKPTFLLLYFYVYLIAFLFLEAQENLPCGTPFIS